MLWFEIFLTWVVNFHMGMNSEVYSPIYFIDQYGEDLFGHPQNLSRINNSNCIKL